MNTETLLTPEEVAEILNLTVEQAVELIVAGKIRSSLLNEGRSGTHLVSPRVLETWIARRGLIIGMFERQMLTAKAVKEAEYIAAEKEFSKRWAHKQMVAAVEWAEQMVRAIESPDKKVEQMRCGGQEQADHGFASKPLKCDVPPLS